VAVAVDWTNSRVIFNEKTYRSTFSLDIEGGTPLKGDLLSPDLYNQIHVTNHMIAGNISKYLFNILGTADNSISYLRTDIPNSVAVNVECRGMCGQSIATGIFFDIICNFIR
jgi:hypothetical protein